MDAKTQVVDAKMQVQGLRKLGIDRGQADELAAYLGTAYRLDPELAPPRLPLTDEPFVACWREWEHRARRQGAWATLVPHLPQLAFPVQAGISSEEEYRAATLRGVSTDGLPTATGLPVVAPGSLELAIHPTPAGNIPVLRVRERTDFVALVQALANRNEPVPVPPAQGAVMVAGYINWSRLGALRRGWEETPPTHRRSSTWSEELSSLRPHKELYQDRFMILSEGPYSAVPAAELGLEDESWRETSFAIRRDHEAVHYFTRRLFGRMRNHAFDELLADWGGLVAGAGRFRADWFLRFLGLEEHPAYREGSRLDLYRGTPPLSPGAFEVLRELLVRTAHNLERMDSLLLDADRSVAARARALVLLAGMRLDELAADDAADHVAAAVARRPETPRNTESPGPG